METLSEWLAEELKKRELSYRQLAQLAGVSNPLISRVITGDMPPSADFCIKIATALDVSPVTLLVMAGHLPPSTPASPGPITAEITQLLESLTLEQRKDVLRYARFISQNRPDEK